VRPGPKSAWDRWSGCSGVGPSRAPDRGASCLSMTAWFLQLFLGSASSWRKPRFLRLIRGSRPRAPKDRALGASLPSCIHLPKDVDQPMSDRTARHATRARDRAQKRLSRLTRLTAFAAAGLTAFMGVVVAHERPGSSSTATTVTATSGAASTASSATSTTTVPTTTQPTSAPPPSSESDGSQASSSTQPTGAPSTTTTTSPPPTTTTTRPVATSGATSHR
jgi:hypothetical protein